MSGILTIMNPRFASKLATIDDLRALPAPVSLGPLHHPTPHATLVEAIQAEAERRGLNIARQAYALGAVGKALFAVFDFLGAAGSNAERGISLAIRNSTDQSLAIHGVAGSHVHICDNLTLAGQTFALKRKNTTGIDLADAVARGFDRFIKQTEELSLEIERMQSSMLTDEQAKAIAYAVFAGGLLPLRLLPEVNENYFDAKEEMTDCAPRSLWGLHNAFTRALRDVTPVRRIGATIAIGKFFSKK